MLKISNKTKITLIILILICLVIGISYFTYAFQVTRINGTETNKRISLQGQILKVQYSDGTEVLTTKQDEYFIPGSSITKTFTIKNTGNIRVSYSINLSDITNDFVRETDLVYELKSGDEILDSNIFPKENIFLVSKQTLNVEEEKEYTLTIKYLESKENQIIDQGKTISARITIDEDFKSIKSLKVYGNSYQDGTPTAETPIEIQSLGRQKNIFNVDKFVELVKQYDSTAVVTEIDGRRVITFKNYRLYQKNFSEVAKFEPGKQYVWRMDIKAIQSDVGGLYLGYIYEGQDYSTVNPSQYTHSRNDYTEFKQTKIVVSSSGKNVSQIGFSYGSGGTWAIDLDSIQIEEGSTVTEYNTSKFEIPITVGGKNLFNRTGIELTGQNAHGGFGQTGISFSNGIYTIPNYGAFGYLFDNLPSGNKYTMSIKVNSELEGNRLGTGFNRYLNSAISNSTKTHTNLIANTRYSHSFTSIESNIIGFSFVNYNTSTTLQVSEIQLEKGTIATEYEPYTGRTFNVYLNEPLRSIGSCTDCSDYLDINNNQIVRNVGIIESYNGESVNTEYMSSTGGLDTGATILYKLNTPDIEEYDFRKVLKLSYPKGDLYDLCTGGMCASNVEVEYNE